MSHSRLLLAFIALSACSAFADPLSRKTDVDFFRDVSSRDLKGLAARSDGRLVLGPVVTDLKGPPPAPILWCLTEGPSGTWIAGAGPKGRILEIRADTSGGAVSSKELINLGDVQVYAVASLAGGSVLAGTSPTGGLCLVKDGKVTARTGLPVESIYDLSVSEDGKTALVATGNPGRIFSVDLEAFAKAGVSAEKTSEAKALDARGITLFGEVSERNLRRIIRLPDGRVVAGSAPKGNLYVFEKAGQPAYLLQENHDAEVTDLLADGKGGFFASIVYSGGDIHPSIQNILVSTNPDGTVSVLGTGPSPAPGAGAGAARPQPMPAELANAASPAEKFSGRSSLLRFSAEGFAETLASRAGVAFYRMARMGDVILIAAGEQGEILGYDIENRLSLTYPASASSQVNMVLAVAGQPGKFLALRNNAPGLALLDFGASSARTAQTKRVDLGATARLGAFRIDRLRDIDASKVSVFVRTTNGANDTDGWSPWTLMKGGDGWRANVPAGRYAQLRVEVPADSAPTLQIDRGSLYYLGQNHRPTLIDFRMLSPNYAIVVAPENPPSVTTTVGQLIQASEHEEHRKSGFLGSQVVASPGTRAVFWTVNDSDGDNLLYTFSIRREGDPKWTDISVKSRDAFAQFDTAHLQEGTWYTRLVAEETSPRPESERLAVTFETDDMVIDHTPPVIDKAEAKRVDGKVLVSVRGHDALSLIDSAEFTFNNGVHETVEQPVDGILDGHEEAFVLEIASDRAAGATSVEVTLYDAAGNSSTTRLSL